MSDGVKFIFKTLFKVPVIIFVSFFIFNILAFFLIYFKMLGFSYVIMQTAVENNYLPTQELNQLAEYAHNMEKDTIFQNNTYIITWYDASASTNADQDSRAQKDVVYGIPKAGGSPGYMTNRFGFSGDSGTATANGDYKGDASQKKQYGRTSRVGCCTEYQIVWPLDYKDTFTQEYVPGLGGGAATTKGDSELEQMREDNTIKIPIRIVYQVPGLKYYPDLINY